MPKGFQNIYAFDGAVGLVFLGLCYRLSIVFNVPSRSLIEGA
jgi:hypothetical protein